MVDLSHLLFYFIEFLLILYKSSTFYLQFINYWVP